MLNFVLIYAVCWATELYSVITVYLLAPNAITTLLIVYALFCSCSIRVWCAELRWHAQVWGAGTRWRMNPLHPVLSLPAIYAFLIALEIGRYADVFGHVARNIEFGLLFWLLVSGVDQEQCYDASWHALRTCGAVTWLRERLAHCDDVEQQNTALRQWLINSWWKTPTNAAVGVERQFMFACEPHGAACVGFASRFAAGDVLGGRVRIIAHWTHEYAPWFNQLYAWFGVVNNFTSTFDNVVGERDEHVAVIPSGITGLRNALLDESYGVDRDTVRVYRRAPDDLGFLVMARRHHMLLVPTLASNERHVTRSYTLWRRFPLLSTVTLFTFRARARLLFGAPLDTHAYETIEQLGDAYYEALAQVARTAELRFEMRQLPSLRCGTLPQPPPAAPSTSTA